MNVIAVMIISVKLANPDLLQKTEFRKKDPWHQNVEDATSKTLSRDPNYVIDIIMWPKFGNTSDSLGEIITISILQEFELKRPNM